MRSLFFICLSTFLFSCNSSSKKKENEKNADAASNTISPVVLTPAGLPASIKFTGKLAEAWQWKDQLGENILITSFVEPYDDKEKNEYGEEGQSAGLYATQYVKKTDSYGLIWKNEDGEKSCPFDITCKFIKDATTITDLDKDGVAETTVQYRLACRSDVSPSVMKLVLYEGTAKYFLQGLSWIKTVEEDKFTVTEKDANLETLPGYKKTEDEYMKTFGRYESEKGFAGAPSEFLTYARQQWMKFVKESFE